MSCAGDIRERYHRALLELRIELGDDRSAVEFRDGTVRWTLFAGRHPMPDQGWKIHIASRRAAPVCEGRAGTTRKRLRVQDAGID
jgi:hypothetical protein